MVLVHVSVLRSSGLAFNVLLLGSCVQLSRSLPPMKTPLLTAPVPTLPLLRLMLETPYFAILTQLLHRCMLPLSLQNGMSSLAWSPAHALPSFRVPRSRLPITPIRTLEGDDGAATSFYEYLHVAAYLAAKLLVGEMAGRNCGDRRCKNGGNHRHHPIPIPTKNNIQTKHTITERAPVGSGS